MMDVGTRSRRDRIYRQCHAAAAVVVVTVVPVELYCIVQSV